MSNHSISGTAKEEEIPSQFPRIVVQFNKLSALENNTSLQGFGDFVPRFTEMDERAGGRAGGRAGSSTEDSLGGPRATSRDPYRKLGLFLTERSSHRPHRHPRE
uniref:Uncharacterized protein n=1 Tax=Nelumbo nucifera TaxID=4432 RepID=A0A822YAP3_NELNU|nr:TPA_asm: hypothetical protein HUJ06_030840 [Nelumbo nucifera]